MSISMIWLARWLIWTISMIGGLFDCTYRLHDDSSSFHNQKPFLMRCQISKNVFSIPMFLSCWDGMSYDNENGYNGAPSASQSQTEFSVVSFHGAASALFMALRQQLSSMLLQCLGDDIHRQLYPPSFQLSQRSELWIPSWTLLTWQSCPLQPFSERACASQPRTL